MQNFTKKISTILVMILLAMLALALLFHDNDRVIKIANPNKVLLNDSLVVKQSIVDSGVKQAMISADQNFKPERVRSKRTRAVLSGVLKDSLVATKRDSVPLVVVSVRMDSSVKATATVTEQAQPANQPPALLPAVITKKDVPISTAEFSVERERIYNDVLNLIKSKIVVTQRVEPPIAVLPVKETLLAANFSAAAPDIGVRAAKNKGPAKRGIGFAVGPTRSVSRIGVISPLLGELSCNYRANGRLQIQLAASVASFRWSSGKAGSLVGVDFVSQYAFRVSSRVQPTLSLGLGLARAGELQMEARPLVKTMLAGGGIKYRLSEQLSLDAQLQYKLLLKSSANDNSLQRDGFITFKAGVSFFFNETKETQNHHEENLMAEKI